MSEEMCYKQLEKRRIQESGQFSHVHWISNTAVHGWQIYGNLYPSWKSYTYNQPEQTKRTRIHRIYSVGRVRTKSERGPWDVKRAIEDFRLRCLNENGERAEDTIQLISQMLFTYPAVALMPLVLVTFIYLANGRTQRYRETDDRLSYGKVYFQNSVD